MRAHVHDGGFAPRSDERIASTIKGLERSAVARTKRAARNPESHTHRQDTELPPDFTTPAAERVAVQIRYGNWDAAIAEVKIIAAEWAMWQSERLPIASLPEGRLLASHVSRLGLPQRTTNLIESLGIATLGGLRESFPDEFVGVRNCGLQMVKSIAQALVSAGLLEFDKAAAAVAEWEIRSYMHASC